MILGFYCGIGLNLILVEQILPWQHVVVDPRQSPCCLQDLYLAVVVCGIPEFFAASQGIIYRKPVDQAEFSRIGLKLSSKAS
jgi:hypothetical protein